VGSGAPAVGGGYLIGAALAGRGVGADPAMIIRLTNLTLGYRRHPAVHHLNGQFAPGSLTALVGPNGAGKSTLLKGIMGLIAPLDGNVELLNAAKRHRHPTRHIAYLPQQSALDGDFPITVLDTVMMGLWHRVGAFRAIGRQARAEAEAALAAVGLAGFEGRQFNGLSVGQRQRVLFARVLLADHPVILLDEPFAALDARTVTDLLDVVRRWHGEGRTVLAVLHDLEQVRSHFPETLLIARDPIAWGPTATVLTHENLRRARNMAEAWNEAADDCRRDTAHA